MKERGIIMQGESVLGILEGRKTQTRRVIKLPNKENATICGQAAQPGCAILAWGGGAWNKASRQECLHNPYGQPGDHLYVKETWMPFTENGVYSGMAIYRATDKPEQDDDRPLKWRPPIFMPRWASRITLEIVNVRVERVQDISKEDAKNEGCHRSFHPTYPELASPDNWTYKADFAFLWNSINAKRGYGWDINPYCWVIEFRVLK